MTQYHKLVRDRIPEILDQKGIAYEQSIADDTQFERELIMKLQEEIAEFAEAQNSEELADILEVVDALKKLERFRDVLEVQSKKREERGGFEKRLILKGEK